MPPGSRTARTRPMIGLAAVAALALGTLTPAPAMAATTDYAALVNPFVGVESEGNAYPGATTPFGMVQLSPDNTNSYASTSYSINAGRVWGFSHRHINSAGCPAAGEILVTPTTTATPVTSRQFIRLKDQATTEKARAGYYTATLANDVRAELTASTRVGVHRYTFPATATANLSINVGQTLRDAGASHVEWVDATTVEGWVDNGGFCGGTPDTARIFFSGTLDRTPTSTGVWGTNAVASVGGTSSDAAAGNNGAFATFDTTTDADVNLALGISYVDVAGARANRAAEVPDASAFDTVLAATTERWNEQLSVAEITASEPAQRIFYTQLYKSLISPTIGNDVDGRYRGMDLAVHTANGWNYHQTFSLWDTYRTQATLHALVAPDTAEDIVRSMHQHRIEGGWLPRWSLGPLETNIMAGDPVSAWIAENFAMGTVPDDIADSLWGYLIENATTKPPASVRSVGRQSAAEWIAQSHIPFYFEDLPGLGREYEEYRHGGSSSMEFALSDSAIGAAAQRLGKTDDAATFLERGRNWQRLWNPEVTLDDRFAGTVNAVFPDGSFNVATPTGQVQQTGFHEGTQWQYQWMANQDIVGLVDKMGGRDAFLERLDTYFAMDSLLANPGVSPSGWARGGSDYYNTTGYNPGNEPTIMNPWLYGGVGQPVKTNDVLAANLNRFPNTPGGGVGNDDLGTMSSWYVMATLGFQPIAPGSGILALNSPRVTAATVKVGDGNTLRVTAAGAHESLPRYTQGLTVDGVDHTAAWIDVAEIQDGAQLVYDLTPNRDGLTWATDAADWIPSVSAPVRASATVTPAADAVIDADGTPATVAMATFAEPQTRSFVSPASRGDISESVTPAVALTVGGVDVPVTATFAQGAWQVVAEAGTLAPGAHTGTLTVTAPAPAGAFAPAAFAPQSVEVSLTVASPPVVEPPFDPALKGGIEVPETVVAGNRMPVTFGAGAVEDAEYTIRMFSTPVTLATATLPASRILEVTIPGDARGEHTIAAFAADGELVGWDTVRVLAPSSDAGTSPAETGRGDLASSGLTSRIVPLAGGALALVLLGLVAVLGRQRRMHPKGEV